MFDPAQQYVLPPGQLQQMQDESPFIIFQQWLELAEETEPNDANAMSLATTDGANMPDVRIVLLKGLDESQGFIFYTNTQSSKGQQLSANPKAALAFHWKSLLRQVRIKGIVEPVSEAMADAYFASRAHDSQIGAHASKQSQPLTQRAEFEARVAEFEARYPDGTAVPRPEHWSGYCVKPLSIEFWQQQPYRLHDRLVFQRDSLDGQWNTTLLYP